MKQYHCKRCISDFIYSDDEDFPKRCPSCDAVYCTLHWQVVENNYDGVNIDCTMKENLRYSNSLGVNPNQIPAARKIHPDAEFTSDGRMVIHNRHEKMKRLKERTDFYRRCGSKMSFVEYD